MSASLILSEAILDHFPGCAVEPAAA